MLMPDKISSTLDAEQPRDWHVEDIKAALRKRGVTLTRIAKGLGVTPHAVSLCLRYRISRRLEDAIAAELNITPQDIWPSRFRGR